MALPYPKSNLDAAQVLQYAFADDTQTLRTTASFSGSVTINLDPATDGIYIGDPDNGNTLEVNADGSINANISINHTSDSVRLGNGTDFITSTTVGPAKTLDVTVKEMPLTVASESTLVAIQSLLTTLNSLETTANSLLTSIDTKVLTDAQIRATPLNVNVSNDVNLSAATLAALENTTVSVSNFPSTQDVNIINSTIPVILQDEPIKMSGTENGQPSGTEFTIVNNRRLQILDAKDREQTLTYADFGTKDERITQIDYVSPSIGVGAGFTARKTILYTLVSGKYRRDNINWNLI